MFEGFSQRTIDFMWNLRFNNEKSWFEAHKEEYKREFLQPMRELSREVYERLHADGRRGLIYKVSRIYKDARRPYRDGPYRDHLWFSIERPSEEWTATPTFWFELMPDHWASGLGYYQARPSTMARLRARIDANPKKFERLIAPLAGQDAFVLQGPEYKRVKTAPSEKTAAWYNKKSLTVIHEQANGPELFSPALVDQLASGFEFLLPLYDFLVTLDADPEPGDNG